MIYRSCEFGFRREHRIQLVVFKNSQRGQTTDSAEEGQTSSGQVNSLVTIIQKKKKK